MITCLTGARFNMKADILRQGDISTAPETDGEWIDVRDPDSGEIVRKWQPIDIDNPDTPEVETLESFACEARGIIDGGIRVSGTTERFGEIYDNVDYVKITFPAGTPLSRRDRVTNIRDANGNVIWKEEENGGKPTIFNVSGITPIIAPFVGHIESFALLERAEAQ
jgi:hypothetical protein